MLTKLVSSELCDELTNAKRAGMGFRDECWPQAESVREQDRSCIETTTTAIALKTFTVSHSRSHLIAWSCPTPA